MLLLRRECPKAAARTCVEEFPVFLSFGHSCYPDIISFKLCVSEKYAHRNFWFTNGAVEEIERKEKETNKGLCRTSIRFICPF